MYLFECQIDAVPCPVEMQQKVMTLTTEHFQVLGITSESIGVAITIGFGIIMFFSMFGMAAGMIKKMIDKL